MRQKLTASAIPIALAFSGPVLAQGNGNGILYLSAVCDGEANVVKINAQDRGGLPELVGFDIYRQKLGDCAEHAFVRITDQPLSRTYNADFTISVVDDNIEPATMYCYRVVGVDAGGEELRDLWPAYIEPDGVFTSCSSCGLAPVAHGTLEDGGWTYYVLPCSGVCYGSWAGWIEEWASNSEIDFAEIAATGESHLFYGDIGCGTVEGCFLAIQHVEPAACTVVVTSGAWGAVKTLYR